jgi:hypothetical protein
MEFEKFNSMLLVSLLFFPWVYHIFIPTLILYNTDNIHWGTYCCDIVYTSRMLYQVTELLLFHAPMTLVFISFFCIRAF